MTLAPFAIFSVIVALTMLGLASTYRNVAVKTSDRKYKMHYLGKTFTLLRYARLWLWFTVGFSFLDLILYAGRQ